MAWQVFRDPALAYSMVALGALLPDALDLALGGSGPGHSVVIGASALALVMVATRGRRRLRRRLLGIPLGFLLHLVLDGAWMSAPSLLWWPLAGFDTSGPVPITERPAQLLLAMEVGGLILGASAWRAIGSARAAREDPELKPTSTGDA